MPRPSDAHRPHPDPMVDRGRRRLTNAPLALQVLQAEVRPDGTRLITEARILTGPSPAGADIVYLYPA